MVNRSIFVWILRLIFLGVLAVHIAYLTWAGNSPQGPSNVPELLRFLWAPIASGVTATAGFYFVFEKWLWRFPWMRGWLVLLPDLTGTWLAKSFGETFANGVHYSLITIKHDFDRLAYRAWRKGSTVVSEACVLERVGQELRLFVVYGNKVGGFKADHGIDHDGCLRLTLLNESTQTFVFARDVGLCGGFSGSTNG
jgi:SMODS-associating 2TM, beta-strand rich effector domain